MKLPPITGCDELANQLAQVLMNFVINGRDAMPGGGVITVVTRRAA